MTDEKLAAIIQIVVEECFARQAMRDASNAGYLSLYGLTETDRAYIYGKAELNWAKELPVRLKAFGY